MQHVVFRKQVKDDEHGIERKNHHIRGYREEQAKAYLTTYQQYEYGCKKHHRQFT